MLTATQFSVIIFYGIVLALLSYRFRQQLRAFRARLHKPLLKHLIYPPALHSRARTHWSRADVLAEALYLGTVAVWVWFRAPSLTTASRRAANLCLGHLTLLCATPHIDSATNTLGLRWRTLRRLHGSLGVMAALLLIFHIVASLHSGIAFPSKKATNLWAIVAGSSISALIITSVPWFRNRWHELFLHIHRCLTAVLIYGIWVHIAPLTLLPRVQLYALLGVSLISLIGRTATLIARNGLFRHKLPRADIMNQSGAVFVRVSLARPVRVKAGQYITLWVFMPSTSLHSLLEYHPFVIASWSESPLHSIDLLIEPRSGFTKHLLDRSRERVDECRALFSGPHGNSVPVGDYQVVVLVATGYGIAAQLPYLKQLLYDYNSRKAKCRRIRLIWQLKTPDLANAMQPLLNDVLIDDTLDGGYIIQLSIFIENTAYSVVYSPRAEVIQGLADWGTIISTELNGKHIKRVQEEDDAPENAIVTGKTLVQTCLMDELLTPPVSATPLVQQEVRMTVQKHEHRDLRLEMLDYQPHF